MHSYQPLILSTFVIQMNARKSYCQFQYICIIIQKTIDYFVGQVSTMEYNIHTPAYLHQLYYIFVYKWVGEASILKKNLRERMKDFCSITPRLQAVFPKLDWFELFIEKKNFIYMFHSILGGDHVIRSPQLRYTRMNIDHDLTVWLYNDAVYFEIFIIPHYFWYGTALSY